MFTRGVTKVRVSDADRKCLAGVLWFWSIMVLEYYGSGSGVLWLKEIAKIMRGCSRDGIEADSWNFVLNAMFYWSPKQSFMDRMDVVRFLGFTHKPRCCILNFFKFV